MKAITPGHCYHLDNFENPLFCQEIQFIEKIPVGETVELKTVNDGTTNEEVLKVLIDRLSFLQAKMSCRENAIALTHIETALLWLEKRTANRKARAIEGKCLA